MANQRTRARRRNTLSRFESRSVLVVALVSGVLGALAGCHPAQTPGVDQVLTGALAAAVTWAAATSAWWTPAVAAGGLALFDAQGWKLALAAAVCVAQFLIGARMESAGIVRAASGAAVVQLALRLDIAHPFGRSALVATAALGLVLVTGVARRPSRVRRRVYLVVAGLGLASFVSLAAATAGALAARQNIEKGVDAATDGLNALRAGDSKAAGERLAEAAVLLGKARGAVRAPWMWPARAVPAVSQHLRAASTLVDAAARSTATVAEAVVDVDLDNIRVRTGVIDVDAVAALAAPLEASLGAVEQLDRAVADSRSGWLVAPLGNRLAELAEETGKATVQARNALEVTRLAPRLLGQDEPRVWLVLFTTPAEARGLGGFPGNFAEVTVADGLISVTRFGRATDLINGGADPAGRTISGPADYLARYGTFGAGGNGTPMKRLFWNNVTLSPDLPSVAQVVAELYPQSGGTAIDGVIIADPYALQGLVGITGPLTVPGTGTTLTTSNTARYLIYDQYEQFPGQNNERKDALADVAQQAVLALLGGELPSPAEMAKWLGEPSRTGHLMIWSLHPEDQEALVRLGVSGKMPAPVSDGIAYTVNNSGPNKLDAYLTRSLNYQATVDDRTGVVSATAVLRFRNTLPVPITLPPDVISNEKGLPPGTNRMYLSVYTPLTVVSGDVDGSPRALAQATELGWNVFSTYLNIAPGDEVVLTIRLGGTVDTSAGYSLQLHPQPLSSGNLTQVSVKISHGSGSLAYSGSLDVVTRLTESGTIRP